MINAFPEDVVSALYAMIENIIEKKLHRIVQGTWNYAEDVDANLSSVTIDTLEFKYVRKSKHVTGLTSGDSVLLLRSPDCPLIIVGVITGNINLAATGEEL